MADSVRAVAPLTPPARRGRGRPRLLNGAEQPATAETLLEAARVQFASHGYEGASLRQIASQAGTSPALIIHRFGSKLGLWQAAVDHVSALLLDGISAIHATAPAQGPLAELRSLAGALVDIVCDTPHLAQFILREITQQDVHFAYVHARLVDPIHAIVQPIIAQACASGDLSDVDPDFFFLAFHGIIVTTVASRGFLARMAPAARDEQSFRAELKRAVLKSINPQTP